MKIVIIGASFAGISAAIASRKKYPQAEISLIDKQATVGYLSGGLVRILIIPSMNYTKHVT